MEQTEKKGKMKIYKVSTELNLSHDVLIEFLKKKGHAVKNHMSSVDDEMMEEILKHFKKEKTDAERHARKKKEIEEKERKRRGDKELTKEEEEEKKKEVKKAVPSEAKEVMKPPVGIELPTETIAPVEVPPVEEIIPAKKIEDEVAKEQVEIEHHVEPVEQLDIFTEPLESIEVVDTKIPEPEIPVTKKESKKVDRKKTDAPEEKLTVPEVIPTTEAESIEKEPVTESEGDKTGSTESTRKRKKKPPTVLDVSLEASMPKMGLKIMGKMELDVDKKKDEEEESEIGPTDGVAGSPETEEERALKKKKKKKKILREKTVPVPTETTEEELKKKKKIVKGKGQTVDMGEVDSAIRRTFQSMDEAGAHLGRGATRKKKREKRAEEELRMVEQTEREKTILRVTEFVTVNELAGMMHVTAAEVISNLMAMGVMASINQRLEFDVITLIAAEFGFDVEKLEEKSSDILEDVEDPPELLAARPPIVTIMGHVDHGKTSLLDYIRNASVVAGEAGGITQHIGAYTVTLDEEKGRQITFLDTPGHAAFTAMRARGAQVTDIAVIVIAADDSVMPQTSEAISHAMAANVPLIFALNKIDKPDANPKRIRQQLSEKNILVEDWGGKYGCVEISAKNGLNIEELLNRILLEADILELKANPNRVARGVVIEAELDKGKGVTATVLVQKGTLRVGDPFIVGSESGKVRLLTDERGKKVDQALPSTPVRVIGFDGMPQAGDVFVVVESDRLAREISIQRQQVKREMAFRAIQRKTLDDISAQIKLGGVKELSLVVKGDVDGSVEALADALMKLSTEEVRINVIHKGIGAISESDVLLASASSAIIIGFHVRPHLNARKLAANELVDIRLYDIIYNAIQDVRNALEGLLAPEVGEEILATVLVRETFKISRLGMIAGCYVQDGKINRNSKIRLLRDGIVLFTGSISTLKRFKDDVRDVDQGYECGISIDGFNDIKVGDIIESFRITETKRVLTA